MDHPGVVRQGREAMINPHVRGVAPRLLWHDQSAGWDLLAFEYIDGTRHADYRPGSPDLPRVVAAMHRLAAIGCPELLVKQARQRWTAYVDREAGLDLLDGDALLHTAADGHSDRPPLDSLHVTPERGKHILDGDRWGGGHRHGTGRAGALLPPATPPRQKTGCATRWRSSSGLGRPRPPTPPPNSNVLPMRGRPRKDHDFQRRRSRIRAALRGDPAAVRNLASGPGRWSSPVRWTTLDGRGRDGSGAGRGEAVCAVAFPCRRRPGAARRTARAGRRSCGS